VGCSAVRKLRHKVNIPLFATYFSSRISSDNPLSFETSAEQSASLLEVSALNDFSFARTLHQTAIIDQLK